VQTDIGFLGWANAKLASRTAFSDGFKALNDYASLTPLGRRVMDAARSYMIGQGVALGL
jgi:hypothetical protein